MDETTAASFDWLALFQGAGVWAVILFFTGWQIVKFSKWFRPHADGFIHDVRERYKATTSLLEKLQTTLAALTAQQAEIVALIRSISSDERRERKAMQALAKLFEGRKCLFGVNVMREMFGDSDDFTVDPVVEEPG